MDNNKACPFCGATVLSQNYFCPGCGKKLKEKPITLSLGKQIFIYLVSLFLPPLGLWWGFKYIKQQDLKIRNVGIAVIVLTVISSVITILITVSLMNSLSASITSQLNGYSNLGL